MPPPADAPFLLACRNQPASPVPVWFMRQAGRSLPEYRAIRGTGSILDAVRDPDLATEVTLQPVRRYGVDAAILYSDIVVPVAAVGFGVDVVAGVGPVVERPFRGAADLDRLGTFDPDVHCPWVQETVSAAVGELGDVPAHRLRRRPVHRGQLPDRGWTVTHPGPHQGPDAGRTPSCGPCCWTGWPPSRPPRSGRR